MENINLPIAVHVFIEKGQEILLLQRAGTGFHDGSWSVPAGRLNSNETIRQAAVREASEEVNAKVDISDLSAPLVMHHKDDRGERLYFFFSCTSWENELANVETEKCSAIKWFAINDLPSDIIPHVKYAIERLYRHETYVEYGFGV